MLWRRGYKDAEAEAGYSLDNSCNSPAVGCSRGGIGLSINYVTPKGQRQAEAKCLSYCFSLIEFNQNFDQKCYMGEGVINGSFCCHIIYGQSQYRIN